MDEFGFMCGGEDPPFVSMRWDLRQIRDFADSASAWGRKRRRLGEPTDEGLHGVPGHEYGHKTLLRDWRQVSTQASDGFVVPAPHIAPVHIEHGARVASVQPQDERDGSASRVLAKGAATENDRLHNALKGIVDENEQVRVRRTEGADPPSSKKACPRSMAGLKIQQAALVGASHFGRAQVVVANARRQTAFKFSQNEIHILAIVGGRDLGEGGTIAVLSEPKAERIGRWGEHQGHYAA